MEVGGYYCEIASLSITNAVVMKENFNLFSLNNFIHEYRPNDRVMIDVPVSNNGTEDVTNYGSFNYLNINNLGAKFIDGNIEANKKYELIYDGSVFYATEVV